jgi:hypothetical protein
LAAVTPAPIVPREHVALGLGDAHEGSTIAVAKLGARTVTYVADDDDSHAGSRVQPSSTKHVTRSS